MSSTGPIDSDQTTPDEEHPEVVEGPPLDPYLPEGEGAYDAEAADDWFSPEAATFGDRLAGAREAAGLKQAELAKRLGVKTKTIRAWENDLSEPRANRVQMLSGLLGVSLSWLLTGEGDGLSGPVETQDLPEDVTGLLKEMRQLRAEMQRGADRLARLEKTLRRRLGEGL